MREKQPPGDSAKTGDARCGTPPPGSFLTRKIELNVFIQLEKLCSRRLDHLELHGEEIILKTMASISKIRLHFPLCS